MIGLEKRISDIPKAPNGQDIPKMPEGRDIPKILEGERSGEKTELPGSTPKERLQELWDSIKEHIEHGIGEAGVEQPDAVEMPNGAKGNGPSELQQSVKDTAEKYVEDAIRGRLEQEYQSNYKERIDQTPKETSERGNWTGERGESTYIPSDTEIQKILEKYGLDGIEYENGIPDFSGCSECTVEIDNMSEKRTGPDGNFAQCDEKCAEKWNQEARDGRTDWTARDVQKWREENGYTWHERNDMKTCDLVPTQINDYFGHLGGVSECRKRDAGMNFGGEFDE